MFILYYYISEIGPNVLYVVLFHNYWIELLVVPDHMLENIGKWNSSYDYYYHNIRLFSP